MQKKEIIAKTIVKLAMAQETEFNNIIKEYHEDHDANKFVINLEQFIKDNKPTENDKVKMLKNLPTKNIYFPKHLIDRVYSLIY